MTSQPFWLDFRSYVAAALIALFWFAYANHPTDTLTGALIAAFAGAWGYYLGSSSGATANREQVARQTEVQAALVDKLPPATPTQVSDKKGE